VTIPQQPAYPAQPPTPPTGWVALTLQGSVMTSNIVPPTVTMNGFPVAASYGRSVVPVHPGRIRVQASCQWLRRYGEAALDIDVAPGQTVPVFYAAPYHQFTTGAMGHEKQQRPGVGGLVLISSLLLAILAAIVGCVVVLLLLVNAS
jgi:hypothetical protein